MQSEQADEDEGGQGSENELTVRSDTAVEPEADERPDGHRDEGDDSG